MPERCFRLHGVCGGRAGVVVFSDIFGDHPNTRRVHVSVPSTHALSFSMNGLHVVCCRRQVCDRLADAGMLVAMPDYFRGKPWPADKFPPPDRDEFMAWIGTFPWEQINKETQPVSGSVDKWMGRGMRAWRR